jgi:hypothetical protein
MFVHIDQLIADTLPVRSIRPASRAADMRASMAALGQLQPLLVVKIGADDQGRPRYEVKDGNSRLIAARELNLEQLEVTELPSDANEFVTAAATASNMVRADLPPVDQWRAIVAMQSRGMALPQAAMALGLSERRAAQLDRLGRLHSSMLKIIEEFGLPSDTALRVIASAPPKTQAEALKVPGAVQRHKGHEAEVNWNIIADACRVQRIPRTRAIFDTTAKGITWEQDLFAPPGDELEFTTSDVAEFMQRQTAALAAMAEASAGKLIISTENPRNLGEVALPRGWTNTHGNPDRPRRHETVYAAITGRGEVVRCCAVNEKAEAQRIAAKEAKAEAAKPADTDSPAANTAGTGDAAPAAASPPARNVTIAGTPQAAGTTPAAAAEAKGPLNKAGQALLAKAKTEALRLTIRSGSPGQPLEDGAPDTANPLEKLVALLVLVIHARNVTITSYEPESDDLLMVDGGRDIVARLINPAGQLQYDATELPRLAAETLARVLSFTMPGETPSTKRSGDTAEWIGAALGAAFNLPRFDTPEFLATMSADALQAAAAHAEVKFTSAAAARRDLAGILSSYRPEWCHFGAPGPKVRTGDQP